MGSLLRLSKSQTFSAESHLVKSSLIVSDYETKCFPYHHQRHHYQNEIKTRDTHSNCPSRQRHRCNRTFHRRACFYQCISASRLFHPEILLISFNPQKSFLIQWSLIWIKVFFIIRSDSAAFGIFQSLSWISPP